MFKCNKLTAYIIVVSLHACAFTPTQVQCPAFYLYHWGQEQVCAWLVIEVELAGGNLLYCHNPVAFNSVLTPKAWPKATSSTRRQLGGTACLCRAAPKAMGCYRGDPETSLIFMLTGNSPQPRKVVLSSSPLSTLKLLLPPAPKEQKYMVVWFPFKSNLTFGAEQ